MNPKIKALVRIHYYNTLEDRFQRHALALVGTVPITNLVFTLDHRVRPPSTKNSTKNTTRVDEGARVLYKVHCEINSENAVTQVI